MDKVRTTRLQDGSQRFDSDLFTRVNDLPEIEASWVFMGEAEGGVDECVHRPLPARG